MKPEVFSYTNLTDAARAVGRERVDTRNETDELCAKHLGTECSDVTDPERLAVQPPVE